MADRNEKDIMLLVNYLEMNPFLKQVLQYVAVYCSVLQYWCVLSVWTL